MPILLCHVVWMPRYQGEDENLPHGFDYVREEGYGHELFNFLPVGGTCYGYVQTRHGVINISRLAAEAEDTFLEDVLVVWTATDVDRKRIVVGWYQGGTIYRSFQRGRVRGRHVGNNRVGYMMSAPAESCFLVPAGNRNFEVPHGGHGLPGQSSVFYPEESDNPEIADWLERLAAYIGAWQGAAVEVGGGNAAVGDAPHGGTGRPRTPDPVHNAEVEAAAVGAVRKHFEGWVIKDRQKDNCGWDLEPRRGDETLCVEIKGLSGSQIAVELTPNEYDAMKRARDTSFKAEYRLAVVTDALGCQPKLWLFTHDSGHRWRCDVSGRTIIVEPREGARLR